MPQKQREQIVGRLRRGEVDVIVATDVAARGLDVERISHVVNYDLPLENEAYVHRIGRTGRAGRSGEAILFVHPREQRALKRLEYATRQTITPMTLPTNRAINKQRVARFHDKISAGLASDELETFRSVVEQYQRQNDVPLELIAAALAALANGDAPLFVTGGIEQAEFTSGGRRRSREDRRSDDKRGNRPSRYATPPPNEADMQTFRIEVGKSHDVGPGNIVGAIANEAAIGSESIGKIRVFDRHSTVDLPQQLAPRILDSLKSVKLAGRPIRISRLESSRPEYGEKRYRNFSKPKNRKPQKKGKFNR